MNLDITTISYLSAAIAFAVLGSFLLINSRGQRLGVLLTFSCMFSALWAGVNAFADFAQGMPLFIESMEIARSGAWLLFLWEVLAQPKDENEQRDLSRLLPIRTGLIALCLILLTIAIYMNSESSSPSRLVSSLDLFGHVLIAIVGMLLVEQLFRNAHPDSRWGIKFMCLSIGAIFAYDFILYSEALLFSRINPNIWTARGLVNTIVSPLILISAARNPQWSVRVHLSRHVVFHTMTLFGAGLYLLVMAAAGYYIRIFGGSWGNVLQIAFFSGASLLLLTILLSGRIRAKLRVGLSKHFFSHQYDYREEWLRFTRTLLGAGSTGQIYEAAIKAIAGLVESNAGALWIEQENSANYACVARQNMVMPDLVIPAEDAMIQFMIRTQWIINLDDYRLGHHHYVDLKLPSWLQDRNDAWLVIPLMLYERLSGFIILSQPLGKIEFNWEVSDLLKAAGHQLANNLAQRQATDALLVARQFDSFNRMSAFVVHDLKNLVAQLSLMLANAEKHKSNPEFQEDMLSTVENTVTKMNHLLSQLGQNHSRGTGKTRIDLAEILETVIKSKSALKPRPTLKANATLYVHAERERLGRVVGHIIQNACEATPYDGRVEVRLEKCEDMIVIEVEDTGKGMDALFIRERLFRPFDSTKHSGMGIGAYECREYFQELDGYVEVESTPEKGTLFRLYLPGSQDRVNEGTQ
jgi:putative PEP-CTERM system histidine kinase